MDQKFYICKKCENMIARVKETKVKVSYRGKKLDK